MMGEDWAAVENIACRDMYFDCVEELCHYLKTEEKFEELYRVAHSAAEIYPFYDWQIWEIDSLIGMSPIQRRPRCLQKNNQADVRRTRPVTIRRNARAIQTYGRANLTGSRRNRRHQVPPPRKRIHRRRLLLHLSKLCGRLPRVRPHDGTNRHVRIPDALHPELYKYRDRRRKSEILFRTSPRVHSESSP